MKKNNQSKTKALINKLKSLAERGEKGEKEVAEKKLKLILSKSKQKKQNSKRKKTFKLTDIGDTKTIMVHCIIDTDNNAIITEDKRKKELYCKLTNEEYDKVVEKFNHYYPEFISQKQSFIKAFLIKNNLGLNSKSEEEEINEEELQEVRNMMSNIEPHPLEIYTLLA